MLEIEKWSEGIPDVIAAIAINQATAADSVYSLLIHIQSEAIFPKDTPQPDLKKWLSFYRNHKVIFSALPQASAMSYVQNFKSSRQFAFSEIDSMFNFQDKKGIKKPLSTFADEPISAIEVKESRTSTAIKKWVIRDFKKYVKNPMYGAGDEKWQQMLFNPATKFLYKIMLPAWICYREYPSRLMWKARQGDIDALDKLFRLDSTTVHDRKIAKVMYRLSHDWLGDYKNLLESQLRQPKVKITPRRVKVCISGELVARSMFFGYQLSSNQISKLFHAIAIDLRKGDRDIDIHEDPERFRRAIQRERTFWLTNFGKILGVRHQNIIS